MSDNWVKENATTEAPWVSRAMVAPCSLPAGLRTSKGRPPAWRSRDLKRSRVTQYRRTRRNAASVLPSPGDGDRPGGGRRELGGELGQEVGGLEHVEEVQGAPTGGSPCP